MIADDIVWGPRTTGEGRNKNMKVEDPWNFEYLNPLSPNSDQHQFSPNNIHMLPRKMVMRVNKIITKEKMLQSVIKFSLLIL